MRSQIVPHTGHYGAQRLVKRFRTSRAQVCASRKRLKRFTSHIAVARILTYSQYTIFLNMASSFRSGVLPGDLTARMTAPFDDVGSPEAVTQLVDLEF